MFEDMIIFAGIVLLIGWLAARARMFGKDARIPAALIWLALSFAVGN